MAVSLHASHYRFGIEELLEATHGWHAALDTNPAQGAIAVDTTFLLRFTVQETGGTAAANTDNQFQVAKNGGAFQSVTTTSSIAKAVASVAFTNGQACTKRLTGTGTFETSGAGCTEDGLSGGAANDIAASGNSETECALQIVGADVAGNDVLTFRLTSPDFTITNDVVPTLTVAGATIVEADGSAAGVGASSILTASVFAGAASAAGVAASVVVAAALWLGVAAAAGLAVPSAVSAAITVATGSAGGLAADAVAAASLAGADGVAAGVAVATADGMDAATGSTASAEGLGTVSGIGAAMAGADATASGSASDSVVGAALSSGLGAAAGIADSTVVGAAVFAGDGGAAGAGTVTGISGATAGVDGLAAGVAIATGQSSGAVESARHIVRISWPHQNESAGGPP